MEFGKLEEANRIRDRFPDVCDSNRNRKTVNVRKSVDDETMTVIQGVAAQTKLSEVERVETVELTDEEKRQLKDRSDFDGSDISKWQHAKRTKGLALNVSIPHPGFLLLRPTQSAARGY